MSRTFASPVRAIVVLGALAAVGPLSVDLYLPAFPELGRSLAATPSMVQVTLAGCLVGLGVGQLVAGPFSDRTGRRRPLLAGLGGYVAGSVLCALSPTVEVLAGARLLQGLAGAVVIVVVQAIMRDVYDGAQLARMLSRLMLVVGVVPILAPVLGGRLVAPIGWRGLFWLLAAMGAGLTLVAWRAVPETRSDQSIRRERGAFRRLLRDGWFVRCLVIATLVYVAILVYVAGAPFAYAARGVEAAQFGLLFGLNAVGLTACGQLNARLVLTFRPVRLIAAGSLVATLAGVAALVLAGTAGVVGLALPLFVLVSATGLMLPNAMALVLERHAEHAGAAAALVGCVQFLASATAVPLSGVAGAASGIPMVVAIAVATGVIAALALSARTPAPSIG
jgi:MFS transporter, DHA1 family, multidrug resistance protein